MKKDHVKELRGDLKQFHEMTRKFYRGELTVPEYKSISGGFGSYAQRGGQRNFAPALLQHIQGFQGNPMEQLQSKLNSGEMSQQQYNQLRGMAENIVRQMMGVLPH